MHTNQVYLNYYDYSHKHTFARIAKDTLVSLIKRAQSSMHTFRKYNLTTIRREVPLIIYCFNWWNPHFGIVGFWFGSHFVTGQSDFQRICTARSAKVELLNGHCFSKLEAHLLRNCLALSFCRCDDGCRCQPTYLWMIQTQKHLVIGIKTQCSQPTFGITFHAYTGWRRVNPITYLINADRGTRQRETT